jgi:hypothetical protein
VRRRLRLRCYRPTHSPPPARLQPSFPGGEGPGGAKGRPVRDRIALPGRLPKRCPDHVGLADLKDLALNTCNGTQASHLLRLPQDPFERPEAWEGKGLWSGAVWVRLSAAGGSAWRSMKGEPKRHSDLALGGGCPRPTRMKGGPKRHSDVALGGGCPRRGGARQHVAQQRSAAVAQQRSVACGSAALGGARWHSAAVGIQRCWHSAALSARGSTGGGAVLGNPWQPA